MLLSRHQNEGQNHDIKIANRSFEKVGQFRHLGTTKPGRFLGGKARPARKVDNLTAICEPIV
jgi:hypothetical protein